MQFQLGTFWYDSRDRERSAIEGVHIHIFVFPHRKNNQFQKKLIRHNPNMVYEYGAPQLPIFLGP